MFTTIKNFILGIFAVLASAFYTGLWIVGVFLAVGLICYLVYKLWSWKTGLEIDESGNVFKRISEKTSVIVEEAQQHV